MNLPAFKRIQKEGIPEAPSWLVKLLYPLNQFLESVYAILNRGVTFTDNISCFLKTLEFTTLSTYTSLAFTEISIPNTLRNKVNGVLVLQVTEGSFEPVASLNGFSVAWYEDNGNVIISFISGLDNDKMYKVKILVF